MSRAAFSLAGVITLVAICVSAAPTSGAELIRPESIGFKRAVYHAATGVLEPVDSGAQERLGHVIWRSTDWSGISYGVGSCERPDESEDMMFDWGDVFVASEISGFGIGYATDASEGPNAVELVVRFYDNSNGFGMNEFPAVAGFELRLPGKPASFAYEFVAWQITVDLEGSGREFMLGDTDLDGDGFPDFGYSYHAGDPGDSTASGPLISEPNDPLSGPGAEDVFDLYLRDPNGPNPCDPNAAFVYYASYWFNDPFIQAHLLLYSGHNCSPYDCGCGDFNGDGRVDLADLSRLLSAYGTHFWSPDYDATVDHVSPAGVGLEDLSALLSVYGLECE